MLTLKEVAKELNVHWKTVRNWALNGTIKAVKIGRQWRVSEEEVNRIKKGER